MTGCVAVGLHYSPPSVHQDKLLDIRAKGRGVSYNRIDPFTAEY